MAVACRIDSLRFTITRFPEKQEFLIPSFFVDPRIFTKIMDFLKFGMCTFCLYLRLRSDIVLFFVSRLTSVH